MSAAAAAAEEAAAMEVTEALVRSATAATALAKGTAASAAARIQRQLCDPVQ